MTRSERDKARRWWPAAMATLVALAVAPRAAANIGLPMLGVIWEAAWWVFVPVVALEALVARRVIGCPWRAAWKVSFVANLVTTAVGLPIVWGLMFLLELWASSATAGLDPDSAWHLVAAVFMFAWLSPALEGALWWIPLAGAVLSVPLFFVSVWIEMGVGRALLDLPDLRIVHRWSWWANGWTYLGMELVWLGSALVLYLDRTAG